MHLTSDIECGNGKIFQTGSYDYRVETLGHTWWPGAYNQYFCFKIKAEPAEDVVLRISIYPDSALGFKSHFMTHFPSKIWFKDMGRKRYFWQCLDMVLGAETRFFKDHIELTLPMEPGMDIILSNCIPLPHSEYNEWLNTLASQHANVLKIETAGESFEGRPLSVARFLPSRAGLPKVFILAGMHSSEFSGVWASMGIIEYLLSSIREAREYRENLDIAILPMMNPDGNVHGYSGHTAEHLDVNISADFRDFAQGKLPKTKENRVLWQWLVENFIPDYFLHFHGYKGGSAGTTPHDGLYGLKDPAATYTDKKHLDRYQATYQRFLFETPGLSAHWRRLGSFGDYMMDFHLAKQYGTISWLYEVNGSTVSCNDQFQRGPQVFGALARAILRDIEPDGRA